MSIKLLEISYQNATAKNGLIAFTKEVRGQANDFQGKYSITPQRIESLFSSKVWIPQPKKGGHRKFEHAVTHDVVEFKNHGHKGGVVDPGAVLTILDAVQKTLNRLCNQIFRYTENNWKKAPDYQAALGRLQTKQERV